MNKLFLSLIVVFFSSVTFASAANDTKTVRFYSDEGDGFTLLYDSENQTDWLAARNYLGTLTQTPNVGDIYIRTRTDNDVGKYRIYRASLQFDTNIIPSGAEIQSAELHLYGVVNYGGVDTVVVGHERSDSILSKEDWYISNYGLSNEFGRAVIPANTYTSIPLSDNALSYIKDKSSVTLGLMTNFDFDEIAPEGGHCGTLCVRSMVVYSADAPGTSTDPYLEITYTYDDGEVESDDTLYTQVVSPYPSTASTSEWAHDTYAWGDSYWCGTTIAGCGCAITSLVMMGRESGVLRGVDGTDVNPGNFNAWLQANDGYDSAGSLFWTKAAEYFGQSTAGRISTPFSVEKFRATSPTELRAAVAADNLKVVGYSGAKYHFFYLSALNFSGYDIRDPFWYETKTTNDTKNIAEHTQDYNDQLDRGVIYKVDTPAVQTGIIEVTLHSPAELLLVDAAGKRTGYVAASGVVEEIPHSGYVQDEVIGSRDDGMTPPHVTKHLLATSAVGQYELHVIGIGDGSYTLSLLLKDEQGTEHRFNHTGQTSLDKDDVFLIDLSTGAVEEVAVDRSAFVAAVAAATADATDEEQRFFERWAHKIFDEIDADRSDQATQHLDVFGVLQEAKDVTSVWLQQVVEKLKQQLASEAA